MSVQYQFNEFDKSCFRADPYRVQFGPWTVQSLSFATDETQHLPPLVFIGGAFQNAWSFYREVKHFLTQRPIILLDLPGQGQNEQQSAELDFGDLADLLQKFVEHESLERIIPVGLSYGSGIAFTFAQRYPERVDRVMLGGVTGSIRPRLGRSLRATFWYLERERHESFADTAVHHLLNLAQRAHTGVRDRLIERMRWGMMELTDNERLRYRDNTTRLFDSALQGNVSVPALVFTSRFDHFTAPFEGRQVAATCERGTFAMIEGGDHLVPLQQPKTVLAIYDAFVNDRPLTDLEGVLVGEAALKACEERRMLDRRPGKDRPVLIEDQSGTQWEATMMDYNAQGCLLRMPACPELADDTEPFSVSVPSLDTSGDAILLPAEQGARAIFMQDAFGGADLARLSMAMPAPTLPGQRRPSLAERLVDFDD